MQDVRCVAAAERLGPALAVCRLKVFEKMDRLGCDQMLGSVRLLSSCNPCRRSLLAVEVAAIMQRLVACLSECPFEDPRHELLTLEVNR